MKTNTNIDSVDSTSQKQLDGYFTVSHKKTGNSFIIKLKSFFKLSIDMPLDKLMNKLLGKKWLDHKERVAEMRANEAIINKILASGDFNQERKEERMYYGSSTQLRTHL